MTMRKAAIFLRVSSKEQREEGYSLEAQERSGGEYASRRSLEIARKWSVAETASKEAQRAAFKEFVQFMKANPSVEVMLFEKPDRMTRNFTDLVTIYELIFKFGKELQFFRTGLVINQKSESTDQMHLDMEVVFARKYAINLREEVLKGMTEKVRRGGFPCTAPVGYLNNRATGELDPERAALVKKLFSLYATGRATLNDVRDAAAKFGLRYKNHSNSLGRASIYTLLQNPIYCGIVHWRDLEVEGNHQPIIARQLFERVREVLGRETRPRVLKFAFRGLAVCGACGSLVTAERHSKRLKDGSTRQYVYYHCTGWKNGGAICAYIREEALMDEISAPLKELKLTPAMASQIQKALRQQVDENGRTAAARKTALQTEETRLKSRLEQAYNDKLDGTITADEFRDRAAGWRARVEKIGQELRQLAEGARPLLEEAGRIIHVAAHAHEIYVKQPDPFERRKLIDIFVSRVVISRDSVLSNLREPFLTLSKVARKAG